MRLLVLAVLALLAWPAAARGQDDRFLPAVQNATTTWNSKGGSWVYHDPRADTAGPIDAEQLDTVVAASDGYVCFAILPTRAAEGRSPDQIMRALEAGSFGHGTRVLVMDREYRAISDDEEVPAQRLLEEAIAERPGDLQGALELFVVRVVAATPPGPGFWWVWLIVGPILLFFAGGVVYAIYVTARTRRPRRA